MTTFEIQTPRHGTQYAEAETLAEARRVAWMLFHAVDVVRVTQ